MSADRSAIERALLHEVLAHPDDDDRRLMLADFLKERADPWGELIDLQVRLARLPTAHPDRVSLDFRVRRLLAERGASIAGEVAKRCAAYQFSRGLITHVTMTAPSFAKYFDQLVADHPIESLRVRPLDNAALAQLARTPALSKLRRLELHRSGADPEIALTELCASEHLDQLSQLSLSQLETDGEDAEAALAVLRAPRLLQLTVTGAALSPRALAGLARNQTPPPLRRLELSGRADVDESSLLQGLRALGNAPAFSALERVSLDGWRGVWRVEEWLDGPQAKQLVHLRLGEGPRADDVAQALSRWPHSAIEHLDLSDTYLSKTGLEALLSWSGSAKLVSLGVPLMLRRLVPAHIATL